MEGITPMEGVMETQTIYITQSTGHSATMDIDANECDNADFAQSTGHSAHGHPTVNECKYADFTSSTGHSAFSYPLVNECYNADFTSSTGHSAFSYPIANECNNADFAYSTGHSAFSLVNESIYADFTYSTGHSAFSNPLVNEGKKADFTHSTGHSAFSYPIANECNNADFAYSTGHSAFSLVNESIYADFTYSTGHSAFSNPLVNEGKKADFTHSTGHSAFSTIKPKVASTIQDVTVSSIDKQGIISMTDLTNRMKKCQISTKSTKNRQSRKKSTGFQAYIPLAWPIKQNMYVGMNITCERYIENLHLLGSAWVQKVQHVARLTLNLPSGPIWPTDIEPLALQFFEYLKTQPSPGAIRKRADFADELDFVWRVWPFWLPGSHLEFIRLWEYVTGMARTWGWNWHNEARKQGAPERVWRKEDRKPRTRYYQNDKRSAMAHHHILVDHKVPPVATFIRTNRFYRVGDDETACIRRDPSPRCRFHCHHLKEARDLKKLKKKHGLIRAPGVEPENEYGGIE